MKAKLIINNEEFEARITKKQFNQINANKRSTNKVLTDDARANALMRNLREFAAEHNEKKIDWNNLYQPKFYFYYDHQSEEFEVCCSCQTQRMHVYFDSELTAQLAINTFYGELIWYFKEYQMCT